MTSSWGRPHNCTANGIPFSSNPTGIDAAGCPMAFHDANHATSTDERYIVRAIPLPTMSFNNGGALGIDGINTTSAV